MTANKTHKIIIADDHQLFVDGLVRILKDQGDYEITGICHNTPDLFQKLKTSTPDLVILDIQMPGANGIEACQYLKGHYRQLKIVIISMLDAEHILTDSVSAGADGFIPKTTDANVLKDALKQILSGQKIYMTTEKSGEKQKVAEAGIASLTSREREVIRLIKEGKTTKEIAEELFLSEYTIETHRKNILKKLKLKSATELIAYAFENYL